MNARVALVGVALLAVVLASSASANKAKTNAAIRKSFAVFRHAKTRKDVIHARRESKSERAKLAAANSRRVYAAPNFKVYLVADGDQLCERYVEPAGGGLGCHTIANLQTAKPPAMMLTKRPAGSTKASKVITVIPIVDGVQAVLKTSADGLRSQLRVRNNIVVDESTQDCRYEWTNPSGIHAVINVTVATLTPPVP